MNPGDMGQDVGRTGPDDTSGLGAVATPGHATLASIKLAESPRTQETLQDIQDIIDKLAAITQQLRRPSQSGRAAADPVELGGKAAQ
jgi:hypothetical protein